MKRNDYPNKDGVEQLNGREEMRQARMLDVIHYPSKDDEKTKSDDETEPDDNED